MPIIKNNLSRIKLIILAVFIIGLFVPYVYAKDMCVDCHKKEEFNILNKRLFFYYENWTNSTHDLADVKCIECHGGDETETDEDKAHKGNFLSLRGNEKKYFIVIPTLCGKCHKEVLQHFISSKHYKAISKKEIGPNCVTCHGSMNNQVYRAVAIAEACAVCHNEETELNHEVGEQAEKILRTINISTAYKGWVLSSYVDKGSKEEIGINQQFKSIANFWHEFNFTALGDKPEKLLNNLKSIIKKDTASKKDKKKK